MPATIIRSLWRGVARNAPAPKRSTSKRAAPKAIISMAQQARPKVIGQMELFLAQFSAKSTLVTIRPSSKRFSIQLITGPSLGLGWCGIVGQGVVGRQPLEEAVTRRDKPGG